MNEENKEKTLTKEEREKLQKEKAKKLKAQREMENFKRNYFAYYDDIKISHREDW